MAATVAAQTAARGADHVIVTVGAARAIEDGLALVRRGGDLVVVGMPPDGATVTVDPTALAHDGRRILGSKLGSSQLDVEVPRLAGQYLDGRLELDRLISGRYDLDRINDAVAAVVRGDNVVVY